MKTLIYNWKETINEDELNNVIETKRMVDYMYRTNDFIKNHL